MIPIRSHLLELAAEWRSEAAALRAKAKDGPAYSRLHSRALTSAEQFVRAEELEGCASDLEAHLKP